MCPIFVLTIAFWLMLGFMQLVSAFQVNIRLPKPDQSSIKFIEDELHWLNFSISGYVPSEPIQLTLSVLDPAMAEQVMVKSKFGAQQMNSASIDPAYFSCPQVQSRCEGAYQIRALRIGVSTIRLRASQPAFDRYSEDAIELLVMRPENRTLSHLFTILVALLVSLNYVNMGCALDLVSVQECLRRPIGPIIGLLSQYVCMPVLAFLIGKWLLSDQPYLRLSLFIFGCSCGGMASNMWTVLLNGNLNLSITMTMISTFCAMALMPFWLFTLGRHTFENTKLIVPYRNIIISLASMTIFLAVGLLVQRYMPKMTKVCRRILAPVSGALIVFIVIFGSYVYWYLYKLMTWNIVLAASANVWLGFLFGAVLACMMSRADAIAIAIETGIQNTGITFVVLRLALQQPYEDFAMTIPVAASMMSCLPLVAFYVMIRYCAPADRKSESKQKVYSNNSNNNQNSSSETAPAIVD